jgi:2-oxoglutarate dehydrogenase E1 component
MPLMLHGDAAFAGQGVVYETMQMSQLQGYQTGGTVHVICNNQVGFTTNPSDGRSTPYASDLGKAFQCPVFHVNADDPEEVCRVFKLAGQYRQKFHTDVIVDIIGYRRFGHNEMDEPLFTQPLMYRKIHSHPPVLQIFKKKLQEEKLLSAEEIKAQIDHVESQISKAFDNSRSYEIPKDFWLSTPWGDNAGETFGTKRRIMGSGHPDTGASLETLQAIGNTLTNVPADFKLHPRLKKIIETKKKTLDTGEGIDWGTAEALSFGALLTEGVLVSLSVLDVERGTFSHRHAVFSEQASG